MQTLFRPYVKDLDGHKHTTTQCVARSLNSHVRQPTVTMVSHPKGLPAWSTIQPHLKAWMDTLCKLGCRLNSTTSPSSKWRSTMSPTYICAWKWAGNAHHNIQQRNKMVDM